MKRRAIFLGLLIVVAMNASASGSRTVLWDKTVIPMELVVGVEQMMHFDGSVSPGLSPLLSKKDFFRVMSTSGTVYMTALQPFDVQRIKFKTHDGDYVLVDLSAIAKKAPPKSLPAVHVVSASKDTPAPNSVATGRGGVNAVGRPGQPVTPTVTLFDVLRYGAQRLYSPERVVKPVYGISDVSLDIKSNLRGLYKADQSKNMVIKAVKGWESGGIYVTALAVTNNNAERVLFDPRKLQHTMKHTVNGVNNHFQAVALLQKKRVLGGKGESTNTAYVLVVTNHPFSSVLVI